MPEDQLTDLKVLDERELSAALAREGGWRLHEGTLVRELSTRDFDEAMRLLELIAAGAVDYGRRPDMCITEFNHVRLSIGNPHHAGLTAAELRLAAKVSALLDGFGVEDSSH
jgi:pterin-4a-carbinolamine dehydratase